MRLVTLVLSGCLATACGGGDQAAAAGSSTPKASTAGPEAVSPTGRQRSRRLGEFDAEALFWAMYHWADVVPPIREWLEPGLRQAASQRGEIVDEFFDQEAFLDTLVAELEAPYQAAGDIGYVHATVRGKLGPYDAQFEELYIEPFAPGSGLRAYFEPVQREATVRLVNALDAYAWVLPPEQAQAVLSSLGLQMGRQILVEMELRLTGASVDAHSGSGQLDAEILSYKLFENLAESRGRLLHEAVVLEPSASGESTL
ncbi:hypothetical protein [Kineobactrum salinum]|uniref:Uncharacterized protein n=1 Tax=Kineobactrum salinum TaxID=2708301 RepID=A0A6C0U3F9_9GAMM|nr:hypothetical protein [Kineobactrum salinum]QIB66702.1 hypothetical protein G3T16_16170 [Kineobactrum salinum]